MQISTIKEFLSLAEEMSFSQAAKKHFITQPTLSKHIDSMETELGAKLFVRDTHSVRLTDIGRLFYERMKTVISEYNTAVLSINNAKKGLESTIKIGYLYGACKSFLALACQQFEALHPQTDLQQYSVEMGEAIPRLKSNEYDLVITAALPTDSINNLRCKEIYEDRLVAMLSRSHRLSKRSWVSFKDLANERILIPSQEAMPNVYAYFKQQLGDDKIWGNTEEAFHDIHSSLFFPPSYSAVAVTFAHLKSSYGANTVFLPIVEIESSFYISALWKVARETDALLSFVECLRTAYEIQSRQ